MPIALIGQILQVAMLAMQGVEEAKTALTDINSTVSNAQAAGRDLTNDEVDAITNAAQALRPKS
jgi:hypothetical protein